MDSDRPSTQDTDGLIAPLGSGLRRRRKELGLTLQEIADRAGFSVGFISQIERGITTPSLTSLIAVCRALDVDVSAFFNPPSVEEPVTRKNSRPIYALDASIQSTVTYERLSASFAGSVLRTVVIHHPPGHRSEAMAHEGEEIFFILEGELTLEIDGEAMVLTTGDSAHFPSTRTHLAWNHTPNSVTFLHTCTMDVFGDDGRASQPEPTLAVTRASGRGTPRHGLVPESDTP